LPSHSVDWEQLALQIGVAVFAILGILFIVTAFIAPADYTQFEYQQPQLSWFVNVTPVGSGIVGTGPQAQQLQFAIGIIFLVVAYLLYRRI
jgi:hypothetical protein